MQVIEYRIGVSQVICLVLAGKYSLENKPNLTSTGHTGPPILTAYNMLYVRLHCRRLPQLVFKDTTETGMRYKVGPNRCK